MYFPNILLPDEQIIYEFPTGKRGYKILLVFGISLIFIGILEIPIAGSYFGPSLMGFLFVIGFIFIILYAVTGEVSSAYLITNKRVMEVKIEHGRPIITRSCSIFEIQPVVTRVQIIGRSTLGERSSTSISQELGDIAFIKDGQICLALYNVPNPNNIRDTIIAIIKSSNK